MAYSSQKTGKRVVTIDSTAHQRILHNDCSRLECRSSRPCNVEQHSNVINGEEQCLSLAALFDLKEPSIVNLQSIVVD